jgi:DNA gyrase/topoisomerase IV subunit B
MGDAEAQISLSDRDHVRLRPGMWIGDTSTPNHLLVEAFANSLDCFNAGMGDTIWVDISDEGVVTCRDEGPGFLTGQVRDDGLTYLEASFSVLKTSSKFSNNNGENSKCSLGLNGM